MNCHLTVNFQLKDGTKTKIKVLSSLEDGIRCIKEYLAMPITSSVMLIVAKGKER